MLSDGARCLGLLCLDNARAGEADERFVLVRCKNVVFATGGPAGMYADSVYPLGHCGAAGLAFEAGVRSYQPMNVNFGLFPPLASAVTGENGTRLRGSEKTQAKRRALSARALVDLEQWIAGDEQAAAAE